MVAVSLPEMVAHVAATFGYRLEGTPDGYRLVDGHTGASAAILVPMTDDPTTHDLDDDEATSTGAS